MSTIEDSDTAYRHDVVIIGGGAGGIAVAASLIKRRPKLDIAIIEPNTEHYYQPGWTLVGGGVFDAEQTRRSTQDVMPAAATWVRASARRIDAEAGVVELDDGRVLGLSRLVVAPGLVLDWAAIDGLEDSLGQYGVTSNYRYDLAPYTWSLVSSLAEAPAPGAGRAKALFTQPPMPIKCAGAPQKAMYLSCDYWRHHGRLDAMDVSFCNAGDALFGVPEYVPALEEYIARYGIDMATRHRLVAVDGPARRAHFVVTSAAGDTREVEMSFDMLHVVPPQRAPGFIAKAGLASEDGWLDLEPYTLQHRHHPTVFGLGDVSATPNAKTAAAVRKQAPVVAANLLASLDDKPLTAAYLGYGSCPLTVEKGRVVLAEFGYGGELQPTFPRWVNDGQRATRLAWWLKARQLPWLYWNGMLKGREWLAKPATRTPPG